VNKFRKQPTQGQRWFGHVVVGVVTYAAVKKWIKSDVGILPALFGALVVGYAHEELDAPVAKGIAALA